MALPQGAVLCLFPASTEKQSGAAMVGATFGLLVTHLLSQWQIADQSLCPLVFKSTQLALKQLIINF